MEQGGGDEREHVELALGRRRRLGRIKALDRFGNEIGLGQQSGGQRADSSRESAMCFLGRIVRVGSMAP